MKQEKNEIDEAFKSADFSEKTWLFFKKNFKPIIIAIVSVLVFGCIFGSVSLYKSCRGCKMMKLYSEIATRDEKLNFVKKYKLSALSGVVYLSLGDESLSNGDFVAAKSEYSAAAEALGKAIVFPRARIGLAIAEYRSGNFEESEKILNSVIYNKTFDSAFRGDAARILVSILKGKGANDQVDALIKEIDGLELSDGSVGMIESIANEN